MDKMGKGLRLSSSLKGGSSRGCNDSGFLSPNFNFEALLSPESLKEVKKFKKLKAEEYQKTLENSMSNKVPAYLACKREKIRILNEKAKKKHIEMLKKRELEELERLRQGQSLKITDLKQVITKKQEKIQKKQALVESLRKKKEEKEKAAQINKQKNLVIESIKNFYNDRIQELKEKIQKERFENKQIKIEHKCFDSVLKNLQKSNHSCNNNDLSE